VNPVERFDDRAAASRVGVRPTVPTSSPAYSTDCRRIRRSPIVARGPASRRACSPRMMRTRLPSSRVPRCARNPSPPKACVTSMPRWKQRNWPKHSVEGVTAFQSFHWFANDAAAAEILRIARPGATAALILNERDERDPSTAAFGELVRRFATDDPSVEELGAVDRRARIDSTSYLPRTGEAATRLRHDADAFFRLVAGSGTLRRALQTIVVRVHLP